MQCNKNDPNGYISRGYFGRKFRSFEIIKCVFKVFSSFSGSFAINELLEIFDNFCRHGNVLLLHRNSANQTSIAVPAVDLLINQKWNHIESKFCEIENGCQIVDVDLDSGDTIPCPTSIHPTSSEFTATSNFVWVNQLTGNVTLRRYIN